MDAFRVGSFRGLDQLLNGKIALPRLSAADEVAFVTQSPMQGVRVSGRIDRDRSHTKTCRGASDPASDLAAIGNEDRLEHCDEEVAAETIGTLASSHCVRTAEFALCAGGPS